MSTDNKISPIDDENFRGQDPWYAGAVWVAFDTGAQINCATNVECSLTYEAKPTFDIQLESTVEVTDLYEPQAGASISCESSVFCFAPVQSSIVPANITCATTVIASAESTLSAEPANIVCASTMTVNETYDPWLPSEIGGMVLWLDGDDPSTITHSNNAVSNWADKSGTGNDVSQVLSESSKPAYNSTGLNSRGIITFAGGDNLRNSSPASFNAIGFTVYIVIVGGSDGVPLQAFYDKNETGDPQEPTWRCFTVSGDDDVQIFDGGINKTATASSAGGNRRIRMVITNSSIAVNNGTTGAANFDITVVASDLCNAINVGTSLMPGGLIQVFNGSIAELLVYAPTISGGDQDLIEAYLDNKWGL